MAVLLPLFLSLVWVTAANAQVNSTLNSTIGVFDLGVGDEEIDEISVVVTLEEEGGASFLASDHAVGLLSQLGDDATIFVGLETFNGQGWASLILDYEGEVDFPNGTGTPALDGARFTNPLTFERRVAVPIDIRSNADYRFTVTRVVAADGTSWSASVKPGTDAAKDIGSQFVPNTVESKFDTSYSIVQETTFSGNCGAAIYTRASVGQVMTTAAGSADVNPASLKRGYVEVGSCAGSGVTAVDGSVVHELGGSNAFLDNELGTGIVIEVVDGEAYIVGVAVDADYPYCLANLVGDEFRRVCFESDASRELNIVNITNREDGSSRPPGETIWIGRFDEEVVAP